MKTKAFLIAVLAFCTAGMFHHGVMAAPHGQVLRPKTAIEVSVACKRFDLMAVDKTQHRLLAAHSRAGTLTVVDLVHNRLEAEIPVGRSSGVAVDTRDGKYFVGTTKGVAVVNSKTLKKTNFIQTPGPTDAMVFSPNNGKLFVGHDDGKELWVINARRDKVTGHIAIPGAPELMAIDPHAHRLYLNIKPRNEVIAINTVTDEIVSHWSSLPTKFPHGLALDVRHHRLYVAGHSHMVSVFSLPSGKQEKGIDIGPGHVDQIAFDSRAGRLYCPSSGRLVVVKVSGRSSTVLGSVPIPKGTHSVAVDPNSHWVWIAYADNNHSYLASFTPVAASKTATYTGHELSGEARISMKEARAIALKAYPGKITDEELEREGGGSGLRYSFDVESDGLTHEVGIDARTGKVLENSREGSNPD